jgi:hypothetical protein
MDHMGVKYKLYAVDGTTKLMVLVKDMLLELERICNLLSDIVTSVDPSCINPYVTISLALIKVSSVVLTLKFQQVMIDTSGPTCGITSGSLILTSVLLDVLIPLIDKRFILL